MKNRKTIIIYIISAIVVLFPFNIFIDNNMILYITELLLRLIVGIVIMVICKKNKFIKYNRFNKKVLLLIPFIFSLMNNTLIIIILKKVNIEINELVIDNLIKSIFLYISVAIFEEVVFRGLLLKQIYDKTKRLLLSLIISSVIFGLFHFVNLISNSFEQVIMQVGYSMLSGMLFSFLYWFSGNMVIPITAHFVFNICNSTLYNLLYNSTFTNDFLIISIINIVISVIYGIILFIFYKKEIKDIS